MTDFKEGDLIRFKATGTEAYLADLNPNKNFREDGEFWSETTTTRTGFSNGPYVESPDDIELVTAAKDLPKLRIPTADELLKYVSSALHHGFGEDIQIIETGSESGEVEVYGRHSSGQYFGATLAVMSLYWADE